MSTKQHTHFTFKQIFADHPIMAQSRILNYDGQLDTFFMNAMVE